MASYKDLTLLTFTSQQGFEEWLAKHHAKSPGAWLKFAKKASGLESISYEQAREAAIMYGWIDGLKHAYDERYYLLRFTQRTKKSKWSAINKKIAQQLERAGKLEPPGRAQVEAAKKDGRWAAAYPSASTMTVPEDFQRALAKNKRAERSFADIDRANRFSILIRLHHARSAESRSALIGELVAMLAAGSVPHPTRARKTAKKKTASKHH